MPENEGQAGGQQGSQDGSGNPEGGAAGADATGQQSGGSSGQKGQDGDEPQYITADKLKGVLASQSKTLTKELSGLITPLQEQITRQQNELEVLRAEAKAEENSGKGGDGKGGQKDSPELVELRRKVAEQADAISKARAEMEKAKQDATTTKFTQIVLDALTRAKCKKPQQVLRMIAPELEYDPEKNPDRVFATVKSDFGEEELDVDDYVKREVAEKSMPELFEGKHRPGSPAGGDQGGGDGQYLFTMDQVRDPAFYEKNAEAIRAALEQGKVKGAKA